MRVRRPPLNEVQAAVQLNRLSRHIRIADSYQHCLRHLLSRAKPPHRDSRSRISPQWLNHIHRNQRQRHRIDCNPLLGEPRSLPAGQPLQARPGSIVMPSLSRPPLAPRPIRPAPDQFRAESITAPRSVRRVSMRAMRIRAVREAAS
jgi:hypothetical protein